MAARQQQQAGNQAALTAKFQEQAKSGTPPASVVPNPQRPAQLAAQEKMMRARFAAVPVTRPAVSSGIKPRPITPTQFVPTIESIAPSNGSTGDVVTVTALFLTDPGQTDVMFNFGKSSVVAERAAPPVINNQTGEVGLSVKTPKTTDTLSGTTKINVTLVDRTRNPYYISQPADFQFDPFPAPTITSVDPFIVASNGIVNVHGARFQNGDVVHFVFPAWVTPRRRVPPSNRTVSCRRRRPLSPPATP